MPEIVLLLAKGPSHGRAIAQKLEVPLSTVQRCLHQLLAELVVDYTLVGRNKEFHLRNTLSLKRYLIDAEYYRLNRLIFRNTWLHPILEKLSRLEAELIIIFGSYATFREKKDSDLDVFMETQNQELKRAGEAIHSRISVKIGQMDVKDLLIQEILANHIIVKGAEEYYERFFAQTASRGKD